MADAAMAPLMCSLIEKAREQGQLEDSAVPSYTPAPDKMLVAHLQPFEATYTDLVQNVSDAVQYLASFLAGNGNPGLTALHPDGYAAFERQQLYMLLLLECLSAFHRNNSLVIKATILFCSSFCAVMNSDISPWHSSPFFVMLQNLTRFNQWKPLCCWLVCWLVCLRQLLLSMWLRQVLVSAVRSTDT